MLDNRCLNENYSGCSCNARLCVLKVLGILAFLVAFLGGAIAGAYASTFVTGAIVPIAIFAIILLIAIVLTLIYEACKCKTNVN